METWRSTSNSALRCTSRLIEIFSCTCCPIPPAVRGGRRDCMKLGEAMYKDQAAKQGAPRAEGGNGGQAEGEKPKEEGPVDAEYEPVDKDKK